MLRAETGEAKVSVNILAMSRAYEGDQKVFYCWWRHACLAILPVPVTRRSRAWLNLGRRTRSLQSDL